MENTPKTALPKCNPALSLHETRATPPSPALALQGIQDLCRRSNPEQGRAVRPRVDKAAAVAQAGNGPAAEPPGRPSSPGGPVAAGGGQQIAGP